MKLGQHSNTVTITIYRRRERSVDRIYDHTCLTARCVIKCNWCNKKKRGFAPVYVPAERKQPMPCADVLVGGVESKSTPRQIPCKLKTAHLSYKGFDRQTTPRSCHLSYFPTYMAFLFDRYFIFELPPAVKFLARSEISNKLRRQLTRHASC